MNDETEILSGGDAPAGERGPISNLFKSITNVLATIAALAHTRLELLTTEVQEEVHRVGEIMVWSLVAVLAAGIGLFLAALVVLPIVLLVPLEQALPVSLATVIAWLVLTFPLSWRSLRNWRSRAAWLVSVTVVPIVVWELRAQVPAAGLAVMRARITLSVDGLEPGPRVDTVARTDLTEGVIAYAVIRAPAGLTQAVIFEWHHGAETERIIEQIHGGAAEGFRAFARKHEFSADSLGAWTVDLLTPQGQLLKRLRFDVVDR